MQLYLSLAVLSVALVTINAQILATSDYPGPILGGETPVSENNPSVEEAKHLVVLELQSQARDLPGPPFVEITDLDVKEQAVAGTRYNLSFKAVYTYSTGEKTTKSCTASVIRPLGSSGGKMTFAEDSDTKEKVRCN